MTIYGFSGKPGAGKSYSVVEHCIIPALKDGRTIYHNMQLNEAALMVISEGKGTLVGFSRDCDPDELVQGAPPGALIVIDESVRYWPSGTKANKVPKHQLEFFTMHRHNVGEDGRTTDIVLICQDFGSQCAAFIRELIEITYYSVKLSHIGASNRYRVEVYQGCVKGDQPSEKRLIRKTVSRYRPEVYNCYVSHTNAQKGVAGEELRDKRASVWRSWQVYAAGAALLLVPIMLYVVWHSVSALKHQTGAKAALASAEHSEASAKAAGAHQGAPGAGPPVAVTPAWSKQWRLSGKLTTPQRGTFFVVDGDGGSRLVEQKRCFYEAGNAICHVDGELVTTWTGPPPPLVNQFVATTLKPAGT